MQEDLLTLPPAFKLYNDRAFYIGTFLGGPLVAGYLAAANYKQLGQTSAVKKAWIVSIIATAAIIGILLLLPSEVIQHTPRYIIPLTYTFLAQLLVQKYQGAAIKKHVADGGQTYSPWRAVWIGLIGFAALAAIIVGILLLANPDALA